MGAPLGPPPTWWLRAAGEVALPTTLVAAVAIMAGLLMVPKVVTVVAEDVATTFKLA
jgi:hypothetical protein